MKRLFSLCAVAAILFSYGCASKPTSVPLSERVQRPRMDEQRPSGLTSESERRREGAILEEDLMKSDAERRRRAAEEARTVGDATKTGRLQDIYFDYDSYAVRSDDVPVLKGIAAWLSNHPAARVIVEGHCDERGTTDYNLALGQKRAEAAKNYLVKLGVADGRIRAVSFGKEAPVDSGHTEDAWSKNRRAHFTTQ